MFASDLLSSFAGSEEVPPPGDPLSRRTTIHATGTAGAAGLKPGTHLNSVELKAHAKLLNDTGLFKEIRFKSDSKTLLFTLTPAGQLFPMHLDNVPLTPGKELDATLRARFPALSRSFASQRLHGGRNLPDI